MLTKRLIQSALINSGTFIIFDGCDIIIERCVNKRNFIVKAIDSKRGYLIYAEKTYGDLSSKDGYLQFEHEIELIICKVFDKIEEYKEGLNEIT